MKASINFGLCLFMIFNLINMDVTLGHFQKNTNKIGPVGEVGKVGPKKVLKGSLSLVVVFVEVKLKIMKEIM